MNKHIPKVATVQDLSGYGRCALTVAIPILSVMGIQVCPIPTAILSTHTGGFGKPVFEDLTQLIDGFIEHWKCLDLQFDALYSGFLGNEEQINQVMSLFATFKNEKTFTLVDPVMGDGGKLYSTYNEVMQHKMKDLVSVADIVTPNLTEMYFLLDRPYTEEALSKEQILELMEQLAALGPKKVVVKGITTLENQKVNVAYDQIDGSYWLLPYEEIPMSYPGTGDAFASVLVGALMKGISLKDGVEKAANFVRKAVEVTSKAGTDSRAGILLEGILSELIEK